MTPARSVPSSVRRPSSGTVTSDPGPRPLLVRITANARPILPSAEATSGNTPSARSTVTSTRSPIPISSASVDTDATGKPSQCETVMRCPPTATRNAVSEPALTNRMRTRCPGRPENVCGVEGERPLIR